MTRTTRQQFRQEESNAIAHEWQERVKRQAALDRFQPPYQVSKWHVFKHDALALVVLCLGWIVAIPLVLFFAPFNYIERHRAA